MVSLSIKEIKMKKLLGRGILLLGIGIIFTAHAANPASKEYVDETFSVIQQTYANLQQQINNLRG